MVEPLNCKIMKKIFFVIAILALDLTACNTSEIDTIETPEPVAASADAPVCYFNLPASFEGDTSTKAVTIGESTATSSFEATDKIYVFIERPGNTPAFAYDESTCKLVPLNISNIKGATCDLSGALKFYYEGPGLVFKSYTPKENDRVHLLYNLNAGLNRPQYPFFRYDSLSGDKDVYEDRWGGGNPNYFFWGANHFDFAEAIMKVTTAVSDNAGSGYSLTLGKVDVPTDTKVCFKSLQSIFRQRLSFKDKGGDPVTPTITRFRINSANNKTVYAYYPFYDDNSPLYDYSYQEIDNPTLSVDRDIYFPLMFNDVNKNDALIFTAYDDAENVYTVTKNAPSGGFTNGKYYFGSAALAWHHNMRPTVTGTSATPSYGKYTIGDNAFNITISGYSEDYYFGISDGHGGTITLDNVTATHSDNFFIAQENVNPAGDISLVLTGTNHISCEDYWGILVYGNLKLKCTGTSATLTVTTYDHQYCGIQGDNYRKDGSGDKYNHYDATTGLDVTAQLAAPGFTVIRSARVDGPDENDDNEPDYYTWTYTVLCAT